MKYFITYILLMTMSFAKGQIVNIPDANFKAALISLGVDTNNDGEIQQTEADLVTDIQLPLLNQDTIRDLTGIRSFTNLVQLNCNEQCLAALDVSGLTLLQQLNYPANIISSLNVSNCTNLEIGLPGSMDSLRIFNAENCPRIKAITFPIIAYYNTLEVNLTNCDSLVTVNWGTTSIHTLNVSECDRITTLIYYYTFGKLIARNCLSLREIRPSIGGASVTSVDVKGCINLETLTIGEAGSFADIDLSTCPNIKTLNILAASIVDHCLKINLKNGTQIEHCNVSAYNWVNNGFPPCINICTDDFELDNIDNWLHINNPDGTPLFNINSYCSFTSAGAYNSIKGKTRLSTGTNCDSTNRGLPNLPIVITDTSGYTVTKYTEAGGDYKHYFYTGSYTIRPYFAYPYFSITPEEANVNFDTANSLTETRDFCIVPNGVHNDLEISFLPYSTPARPGFTSGYKLIYKNQGTTTLSGNVSVNFDYSKMNFTWASQNINTQSTGQLLWNYNSLQPFESRAIEVRFSLLPPPINNIGDTILYLASITPSANDETTFDNSFILPQRVIGSFDPNDKQCLEGSKLDISKIGEYLHYIIHFQNEGTDTAFNIVVADTLSDKLDWNTFEFVSSSHSCNPTLKNNKAEFVFENIHLPYKAIDEPESNGWVAFKIKPKPSVVIGDSLNNRAAIYFDFNLPVITNTATTIISSSSTPVPVKLEYFSVNQKNNTNQLNWKASCTYGNPSFAIERSSDGIYFSGIGNVSATPLRCQLPFNFIDNNPVAGKNYYRLKITDADGISFYSKTLVVGNNKAGIEITAVANNIFYINSNKQQIIQIKVIASDGKELLNEKQTVTSGSNTIILQMKNTAKGIYTFIVYTGEGETITRRFVK